MKLHVYDHCPFCVKARAIFGLKALPVELVVMLNDDAASPERMVGRKVAPILERDGVFTPESMDIVAMVDAMSAPRVLVGPTDPGVGRWIAEGRTPCIGSPFPVGPPLPWPSSPRRRRGPSSSARRRR